MFVRDVLVPTSLKRILKTSVSDKDTWRGLQYLRAWDYSLTISCLGAAGHDLSRVAHGAL